MATNDLKLLGGWFSPFVARVQIALTIKGVNYENIEETLYPKNDLLLQYNPIHTKIPVLIHGDKLLCESAIIVEYIDEVWKNNGTPSILPSNAYDRAIARFWVAYIDDKVLIYIPFFFNGLDKLET
jgi:glutathione S-transferase